MINPVINTIQSQTSLAKKKVLVAYFSHSGNTCEIARQIQEATGADSFEITPVNAYPTDYDAVVKQAKRELQANHRPALRDKLPNMDLYDVVFVGSPNWWSTVAPPVMTFLSAYNLVGKTIAPFITHEGSRLGKSVADVKRLSPGAKVLDGHAFWGSHVREAREEVAGWLRKMERLQVRR